MTEPKEQVELELRDLGPNGKIGILYLNNPQTRNSMTLQMGLSFNQTLKDMATQDPPLRALVISGKNGVFSSGGDFDLLGSFAQKDPDENRSFMENFYRLFLEVRRSPFPVIAAVNGHAIGASLALALACDIRYFVPDAKYAFNFVKIGIHPGMGASLLLREVAGLLHAQELLLTGRYIHGQEAMQRGMCHAVYPAEEILERAIATATEIASAAPQAVRLCKQGLYNHSKLDQALEYEAASQAQNYTTDDFLEAISAIREKRKPEFKDQ